MIGYQIAAILTIVALVVHIGNNPWRNVWLKILHGRWR